MLGPAVALCFVASHSGVVAYVFVFLVGVPRLRFYVFEAAFVSTVCAAGLCFVPARRVVVHACPRVLGLKVVL